MGFDKTIEDQIERKLRAAFLFNPFYQQINQIAFWSCQSFSSGIEKVKAAIVLIKEQLQSEIGLSEEQQKFLGELIRLADHLNAESMQVLNEYIKKNALYLPEYWGSTHPRGVPHSARGEIHPYDAHQIGHAILACPPMRHQKKRSSSLVYPLRESVELGSRSLPVSRQTTPEHHESERSHLAVGSVSPHLLGSSSTFFSSTPSSRLLLPPCFESDIKKWYHLLLSQKITHVFALGEFSTNFFDYTEPGNHEGVQVRKLAESTDGTGASIREIVLSGFRHVNILNLSITEEGLLPEEEGLEKILTFFKEARESNYLIHSTKSIGSASSMLLMFEIYEHLAVEPLTESNTEAFAEWLIEKMTQMRQIRFSCTNIPQVMNAICCADRMVSLQQALELKDVELTF